MLTELWIRNIALIEDAHLQLSKGLTALTGETGAGKSLVVGSLDLALGAKASAGIVRRGADGAEVAARFEAPNHPLAEEGEVLLRRTISADGRSKAYINDRPVTVRALREAGWELADLHGQHEQQGILDEGRHMDLLDAFAGCAELREECGGAVQRLREAAQTLAEFLEDTRRSSEEQEYLTAQLRELQDADPQAGELESLEQERRKLGNAGRLAESVFRAAEAVDGEGGAEALLTRAVEEASEAAAMDSSLVQHATDLEEARVAIQETARDLRRYSDALEADEGRQEFVEARLDLLHRLSRKHHTDSAGLAAKAHALAQKLTGLENAEVRREDLEGDLSAAAAAARTTAAKLTKIRSQAAARLGRRVTQELRALSLPQARFEVRRVELDRGLDAEGQLIDGRGAERMVFHLTANPGEPGGSVSKVASGGELSRVMLALKNVLHKAAPVAVTIFDEIDTGIGGVVAETMGARLADLARNTQVLVVTHQAVIAGRADHQFKLSKLTGDRTTVCIEPLNRKQREVELARMMAGNRGRDGARRAAQALLDGAEAGS